MAETAITVPASELLEALQSAAAELSPDALPPAVIAAPDCSVLAAAFPERTLLASCDPDDRAFWQAFFAESLPKTGFQVKEWLHLAGENGFLSPEAELPLGGFRFDAALAAYLLDPVRPAVPLPDLIATVLQVPPPAADDYAALAAALMTLAARLAPEIEAAEQHELLYEIELPLCSVLAAMELTGVAVDRPALLHYGAELTRVETALQQEILQLAGSKINLNSPKQLGILLFETLGLPAGKKTKSGYATDVETLTKLIPLHPIVPLILQYRQLNKLRTTYVEGLDREIAADGRIHTTFQMTATATGRLSSTEPNLQNIPVRTELGSELRRMFAAGKPDWQLVDADYSQIELRLLAHIAGDKVMTAAFREGRDIHTLTASEVFHVAPEAVTPEIRRKAKAVNFGIVYGISAFALAGDLGISRAEAQAYINGYLAAYPEVAAYRKAVVKAAKTAGVVTTLYHRRRWMPELQSPAFAVRSFGERVALNMPIQGSAADLMKLAMVRVFRRLRREHLEARLILQIHDELIVEAPPSEIAAVKTILQEEMSGVAALSVPLTVEAHSGSNWLAAK